MVDFADISPIEEESELWVMDMEYVVDIPLLKKSAVVVVDGGMNSLAMDVGVGTLAVNDLANAVSSRKIHKLTY